MCFSTVDVLPQCSYHYANYRLWASHGVLASWRRQKEAKWTSTLLGPVHSQPQDPEMAMWALWDSNVWLAVEYEDPHGGLTASVYLDAFVR